MSDEQVSDPSDRFKVDANAQTHFAWLRTRLAVERTMLAYMRTAVSLIGFGFAIFQIVFKYQRSPDITDIRFPDAAWYLGLALILCGILAAFFSVWEYRRLLRYLWSGSYAAVAGIHGGRMLTPLFGISFVIALIGVFAFFAVLLRLL
jgi:putative membrane protein